MGFGVSRFGFRAQGFGVGGSGFEIWIIGIGASGPDYSPHLRQSGQGAVLLLVSVARWAEANFERRVWLGKVSGWRFGVGASSPEAFLLVVTTS